MSHVKKKYFNSKMSRRLVNIDQQIQEFETALQTHLDTNLFQSLNIPYWAEMDQLDNQSLQNIDQVIQAPFEHLMTVYKNTRVESILNGCASLMKHAARIALNTPWIPSPFFMQAIVDRVIDNLMNFYFRVVYVQLRTEMIMVNHWAHIIQRNWRHVVTYPHHPVCKRRLEFECREFQRELEAFSAR